MSAKIEIEEGKHEDLSFSSKMYEFIQRNRRILVIGLISIGVIFFGFAAGFSIRDKLNEKALVTVAELARRYEGMRFDIGEESMKEDVDALLADLESFAGKHGGYTAARAWTVIAGIHGDRKDWAGAEAAWVKAAKAAKKTYLEPVAYFNAAVAAEEGGDLDAAIAHFNESLAESADFPQAPRAQFSIARLEESRNNREAAIESYRALIAKWPGDLWSNLAQSRLVALGAE